MPVSRVHQTGLKRATFGLSVAFGAILATLVAYSDVTHNIWLLGGIALGAGIYLLFRRGRIELGLLPPAALLHALVTIFAAMGWRDGFSNTLALAMGTTGSLSILLLTSWLWRNHPARVSVGIAGGIVVGLAMLGMGLLLADYYANPALVPWPSAIVLALSALWAILLLPEFFLRFLAWVLGNLVYRFRVNGIEHLPEHGAALLVCNHVSFIDWLFIGAISERPVRFVMDRNMFRLPVVRQLCTIGKVIPIAPRKLDAELLEQAMERVHQELQDERLVGIFPEGAITRDGDLGPIRNGFERIVARDPVPVIPMALNGLWGSYFSRIDGAAMKRPLRRGIRNTVTLEIGAPIAPEDATVARIEAEIRRLWEGPPATLERAHPREIEDHDAMFTGDLPAHAAPSASGTEPRDAGVPSADMNTTARP